MGINVPDVLFLHSKHCVWVTLSAAIRVPFKKYIRYEALLLDNAFVR